MRHDDTPGWAGTPAHSGPGETHGPVPMPHSAQRFLHAFTRTWNLFRPRRRSFTAVACRTSLQERFTVWQVAAELRPKPARESSALARPRPSPRLAPRVDTAFGIARTPPVWRLRGRYQSSRSELPLICLNPCKATC